MKRVLGLILLWSGAFSAQAADPAQQLTVAATAGRVEVVRDLLAQGVDANSKSVTGRPAIVSAAFNGNYRTVRALLAAGADPDAADAKGSTALMAAVAFGYHRLVDLLLKSGANVNAKDAAGNTPLTLANRNKQAKIAARLKEAGAAEE